jgi:hypothetical protein
MDKNASAEKSDCVRLASSAKRPRPLLDAELNFNSLVLLSDSYATGAC